MTDLNIIVVDDERIAPDGAMLVKTSIEAIELLDWHQSEGIVIDELWLDYSLGRGDDIFPVLRWLQVGAEILKPPKINKVIAHTSSRSGRQLIVEMLKDHYNVIEDDLPEEEEV